MISNSPIKTFKSILLTEIGAKSISLQYVTTLKIVSFSFLNNRFIFSVQGWIVTLKKRLMFPFLMMFPLIFCDKRFLGLRTVTSSFNMLQFVSWNNSKKLPMELWLVTNYHFIRFEHVKALPTEEKLRSKVFVRWEFVCSFSLLGSNLGVILSTFLFHAWSWTISSFFLVKQCFLLWTFDPLCGHSCLYQ